MRPGQLGKDIDAVARGIIVGAGYEEFLPYVGIDGGGKPTGLAVWVVQEAAKRTGVRAGPGFAP